jgi:hypothetical protein
MIYEGKVGWPTKALGSGSKNAAPQSQNGPIIFNQGTGRYTEAVLAGRVFVAANQAAVALTAAMATTYTGFCLFNPSTSTVNLALLQFGYAFTIAAPTAATVIGLMTGTVVTAATMTAAAAITPRNRLVGSANVAQAIVDDGCTLNGTPVLEQVFSMTGTGATTVPLTLPSNVIEINGSMVIKPNSYVAVYSFAANTACAIFSMMWEEIPA